MIQFLPTVTAIGRNSVTFSVDFVDGAVTNIVKKTTIIVTRTKDPERRGKTKISTDRWSVTNDDRMQHSVELDKALELATNKCKEFAEKIFAAES